MSADVMSAVVLTGHGGLEELEYRQDVPQPAVGPADVLVRVGACGLNRSDVNNRVGWYGASWHGVPTRFPLIQGSAVVGTISAVGRDLDAARVGQRVLVDPIIRDGDRPPTAQAIAYLGADLNGGFAEYVAVPAVNAYPVLSTLTDAELATFPVSYATAEEMLTRGRLERGETVVITGAAGGVGTALVQLANLRGARIVAVTTQSKVERVRALGADLCIPRDSTDDLRIALADALGAEQAVDVVADVIGGGLMVPLLSSLRPGGRYAAGGSIAGLRAEVDLLDVIYKDLEIYGTASSSERSFLTVLEQVETGRLMPVLERAYPLSELHGAQQQLIDHGYVGKLVVVPPA